MFPYSQAAAGVAPGLVLDNLQLREDMRQTPDTIPADQERTIKHIALDKLGAVQPILKHITTIKLVRNQRRNLLNVRIKQPYIPHIHVHNHPASQVRAVGRAGQAGTL